MLDTEIPEYRVEMTRTMTDTARCWSQENREAFRQVIDGLGHCSSTRSVRSSGGQSHGRPHGAFHLLYLADPATRTITVTGGRPCAHRSSCASH